MGGGQHELELHHAGVVLQLAVLDAVQLVGNVRPSNVHLVKEKPNQLPVLRRQKEEKDKRQYSSHCRPAYQYDYERRADHCAG